MLALASTTQTNIAYLEAGGFLLYAVALGLASLALVRCAVLVLTLGRRLLGAAIAHGLAGGLFFSIGDFSTKLFTQGGTRAAFVGTVILG